MKTKFPKWQKSAVKARLIKLIVLALAVTFTAGASAPDKKLTYFTWSGYELDQFHPGYASMHPEGADISVFGDDTEALTKVRAGFSPDLAHPCMDALPRWRAAGLIQPIDTKRIKNWNRIFPLFRNMKGVVDDGKVWMVPWDWGNVSILYRTDKITNPEQSWSLLWNKKYSGKLE